MNKKRNDMEEKTKEILRKVAIAETHPDKAYKELCVLFDVSVSFADWIVSKGYKLNQMNYSNNGGMWFFNKDSIGATTRELYRQFNKEINSY